MSQTHKDAPIRVLAAKNTHTRTLHHCTEHAEGWRRPRPRYVTEHLAHPPAWHLVTEKAVRDAIADGPWTPLTDRDLERGLVPSCFKTRRRWVFGPRTETVVRRVTHYVPCDLDTEANTCFVWPWIHGSDQRGTPGRARRRDEFHSPVRAATRQTLALAAADWNTHGDTAIEPDPVNWNAPAAGGWWD